MEINDLKIGALYTTEYHVDANYIVSNDPYPFHETVELAPGDVFMILDFTEIEETQSLDIEILFERRKMWFTLHYNECMIDNVRRAESYDIPFMALQEVEPGSNSSSFQTSPTSPVDLERHFSPFFSFRRKHER
tara:strand:- start:408 stop:809 length:402 start_codon:yes stop_codon:yes gene_type:complete